jgi:hypothetical protein
MKLLVWDYFRNNHRFFVRLACAKTEDRHAEERDASPCVSLHLLSSYFTGPVFSMIAFYHRALLFSITILVFV